MRKGSQNESRSRRTALAGDGRHHRKSEKHGFELRPAISVASPRKVPVVSGPPTAGAQGEYTAVAGFGAGRGGVRHDYDKNRPKAESQHSSFVPNLRGVRGSSSPSIQSTLCRCQSTAPESSQVLDFQKIFKRKSSKRDGWSLEVGKMFPRNPRRRNIPHKRPPALIF